MIGLGSGVVEKRSSGDRPKSVTASEITLDNVDWFASVPGPVQNLEQFETRLYENSPVLAEAAAMPT